jgi:YD repeat-containing protein
VFARFLLLLLTSIAPQLGSLASANAAQVQVPYAYCYGTGYCGGATIYYDGDLAAQVQRECTKLIDRRLVTTFCACNDSRLPCSAQLQCKINYIIGNSASVTITGKDNYNSSPNNGIWSVTNFIGQCICPSGATAVDSGRCACNGSNVWNGSTCVASCAAGTQSYLGGCGKAAAQPAKTKGKPRQCCDQTPDPIKHATGEKLKEEILFSTPTLDLRLTYNSTNEQQLPAVHQPFGRNWSLNYGLRVWETNGNNAVVLRSDGKMLQFLPPVSGNFYVPESDIADRLEKLVSGVTITGWKFYSATDDSIETYDAEGKVVSIVERNGRAKTFIYSTTSTPDSVANRAGLLLRVDDHFGRSVNFYYDSRARVIKAADPAGNEYKFIYDGASSYVVPGQVPANVLTSVEFPDQRTRLYHYNEQTYTAATNLPYWLTGITDENGNRFAIYQYNSSGQTTLSGFAGGVGTHSVTYNVNGTSTVTDPLGTARTYTYQSIAGVPNTAAISGPACPKCGPAATTYDGNGFVATKTDWNGNLTTYTRADPNGRLDLETSRTEASGSGLARTIATTWHSTFRLPTLIAESGRTTAFTYDANGNLLTRTITDTASSATRVWTYTYSAIGQVLTINGPRTGSSDTTTYTYYADNDSDVGKRGNVATITNAASHVTTFNTYDTNGRPLVITDPNGLVTTLVWNSRGWLTSRTQGSETTIYEYDNAGQLVRVTLPDASYLQYTYDNAHRLTQIADNQGNKIIYTLDNAGNRIQEDIRSLSNTLRQTRSRVFNSVNQLYQDIGGTNPLTQITTYGYDNQGNLTTVTDPLSHVTTNAYDALSRLIQVTAPGSTVTQYGLNARDQLVSVTDPRSNVTSYTVNALDDLTQQVSPDTGTTSNTYDAAGNVLTSTDAKGQVTTYTYDALNRVTEATFHDNSKVQYVYDAGTYGKGHLTSLTEKNPAGTVITTTVYTYDQHGRLVTDTRLISGLNYTTSYIYDSFGRLGRVTYPSGRQLDYGFNAIGRISAINTNPAGGGSAQAVVHSVVYHPFGGVRGFTYGNGQTYSRTYDLDGRISGFTLPGQSHSLTYDADSRITGATYLANPAQSNTYGYDSLDRLTSAITQLTTYGFGYDANANRLTKTVGAGTKTYVYPSTSNKLSAISGGGSWTYSHDANGSITADGTNTFSHDVRGRVVAASTAMGAVTYGLNALGQRYAKTVGGVTTIFHYEKEGRLIAESNPAGTGWVEYFYLGDVPVAVLK